MIYLVPFIFALFPQRSFSFFFVGLKIKSKIANLFHHLESEKKRSLIEPVVQRVGNWHDGRAKTGILLTGETKNNIIVFHPVMMLSCPRELKTQK